jgi:hypothetical protein
MSCGVRFQEKPRLKTLCFFDTPVRHIRLHESLYFLIANDGRRRQSAFIYLHGRCKEGELERGAMAEAARLFSVTHKAMALLLVRNE